MSLPIHAALGSCSYHGQMSGLRKRADPFGLEKKKGEQKADNRFDKIPAHRAAPARGKIHFLRFS